LGVVVRGGGAARWMNNDCDRVYITITDPRCVCLLDYSTNYSTDDAKNVASQAWGDKNRYLLYVPVHCLYSLTSRIFFIFLKTYGEYSNWKNLIF
jgi:hypothetical protein